ncbi:Uncharacterised protein [Mycobacteroides abscessus]|nr:Uncharacterised protein [Mycobacteroides abscessus]
MRFATVKRLTHRSSPRRRANVEQGVRGWVTSRSAVPTAHRSPTTASVTGMPSTRRFSPNRPGGTSRPSSPAHQSASSCPYAYTACSSPPWFARSA